MSDTCGFNLVDDAWIPIGGSEVSLSDAFTEAHELPGWPDGEPGFAAVLLRLMAVIAYRVTGLDDETLDRVQFAERQKQLLDEGRMSPDRVRSYLTQHHDRFWLLNPPAGLPPFAQDPSLAAVDPHPFSKAVPSWASGNNPALGPHADCDASPAAVAARQLLIQRSYAAGGLPHKHPHPLHGKDGQFVAGPLRNTMSLHPVGRTLATTLAGHLVPLRSDGTRFGKPFWETPPPANPVAAHTGVPGLLDQIAGRHDKTMLLESGTGNAPRFVIRVGPGVARDVLHRDPYLLVDSEFAPRKPRTGRAFWREAESLLAQDDQGKQELSAYILDWAREGPAAAIYDPFSWTAVSHNCNKDKNLAWVASTSPDLLNLFEPVAALRVRGFLTLASEAEGKMIKQIAKVRHAADLMPSKAKSKQAVCAPARAEFWRRAERDFWDTAADRLPVEVYTDRLRSHALAGYDTATATLLHDRRTHRFVVESRRWMATWRRRASDATDAPEE
ncbi:MAG: type I-E CRISPR-associated protein Cse1/CasA [bacterium]|nr:type I-E CRISPR-associated protein Cse1/CasA [bacterium]